MFTGLVQACEQVVTKDGARLIVSAPLGVEDWAIGESVAVNGVCLTVVDFLNGLAFDVSEETYDRSALGFLDSGDRVNLERAMRPMDRFGGHIVQGHVDCVGQVVSITELGGSWVFRFDVGSEGDKYLIDKGSITVNGVSLTVVHPDGGQFDVAVIPHTYAETCLSDLGTGSPVNIEFDVLAKHVEKLLAVRP
ncbi:MAG: riboflavin synthase [Fimbriimonadaceae bacterium]